MSDTVARETVSEGDLLKVLGFGLSLVLLLLSAWTEGGEELVVLVFLLSGMAMLASRMQSNSSATLSQSLSSLILFMLIDFTTHNKY